MTSSNQLINFATIIIPSALKGGLIFSWNIFNTVLLENWKTILVVFLIALTIATLKYFFTQRWGTFGSLLYHMFYFLGLYLYINKFGAEVILEDSFKTISFLIYAGGFLMTEVILKFMGIKNLSDFHH